MGIGPERETAAGYARLLHRHVKAAKDQLVAQGMAMDAVYMILLNAVTRVAYEEGGDARLQQVVKLMLQQHAES